jgi:Winged helix DNA-binding domain
LSERLTPRQLNRTTLGRQLLLERERIGVVEATRRAVALQAQEPASPYVALWNRVADLDPADVDRAFRDHAIVKATLMRVTLHTVTAQDYPAFHDAMQPTLRAARLNDRRFRRTGLSHADADALVPKVLAFASEPTTNAEAERWVREQIGEFPEPGIWWAFRQYAPFVHAPTGGAWSFGPRPSYRASPLKAGFGDPVDAAPTLVRRYLEGFGPASIADIAQFCLLSRPLVRAAAEALGDELLELEGPDGKPLVDVPGSSITDAETPAPPRLLGMWDSVLLAYADRGRIVPAEYRRVIARSNGDTLPAILVDGYVAGVWRPVDDGIEATAFRPLTNADWTGLTTEAQALRRFLADREPGVYRRYGRWWADLPAAEVRVLGD